MTSLPSEKYTICVLQFAGQNGCVSPRGCAHWPRKWPDDFCSVGNRIAKYRCSVRTTPHYRHHKTGAAARERRFVWALTKGGCWLLRCHVIWCASLYFVISCSAMRGKAKKAKGDDAFKKKKRKVGRKKLAPATATRAEIHARTLRLAAPRLSLKRHPPLKREGQCGRSSNAFEELSTTRQTPAKQLL